MQENVPHTRAWGGTGYTRVLLLLLGTHMLHLRYIVDMCDQSAMAELVMQVV